MPGMKQSEELGSIQDTLSSLINEHKKIHAELQELEVMVPETLTAIKKIKKLMLLEHHKKEDEVLYKWMINQNPTVDQDIIARILKDHEELETLLQKIEQQADSATSDKMMRSLAYDLSNFIDSYREHIDLEEKFIFQIARGLLSTRVR